MRKSRVVEYKVWVHIEGLDKDGDTVEGDEYFEPHEIGSFPTKEEAEEFRDKIGGAE